jgi:hypothetical protein
MKKKYVVPEMEEVKVDEMVVLDAIADTSTEKLCTDKEGCDGDW